MNIQKDKLYHFIKNQCGKKTINDDTLFWGDLGLEGPKAEEFMEKFGKEFQVDMSAFNPGKYFFTEDDVNSFFQKVYKPDTDLKALEKQDFSVGHLFEVILLCRWFDPKINF